MANSLHLRLFTDLFVYGCVLRGIVFNLQFCLNPAAQIQLHSVAFNSLAYTKKIPLINVANYYCGLRAKP